MKIFISKQEIEELNKEEDYIIKNYGGKESILTELISIKIYNLIKNNLGNEYINRIFTLSSFCPDITLSDYNIKDVDILIRFTNKMLSGFIIKQNDLLNESFITVTKISSNLILSAGKQNNSTDLKLISIEKTLASSNIENLFSLNEKVENELKERFNKEFEDIFFANLFTASQFRKETFDKLPDIEKNKLFQLELEDGFSIGEYVYTLGKKSISKSVYMAISNILKELKYSFSEDLFDIEKLYKEVLDCVNERTMRFLHSRIRNWELVTSELRMIDLIIFKEEIYEINKNKRERAIKKNSIHCALSKFNNVLYEIYCEITNVFALEMNESCILNYGTDDDVICNSIIFKKNIYKIDADYHVICCFSFINLSNSIFNLGNSLLNIDNILNLQISYHGDIIYSITEENKERLLNAKKHVLSVIDISEDNCRVAR